MKIKLASRHRNTSRPILDRSELFRCVGAGLGIIDVGPMLLTSVCVCVCVFSLTLCVKGRRGEQKQIKTFTCTHVPRGNFGAVVAKTASRSRGLGLGAGESTADSHSSHLAAQIEQFALRAFLCS